MFFYKGREFDLVNNWHVFFQIFAETLKDCAKFVCTSLLRLEVLPDYIVLLYL